MKLSTRSRYGLRAMMALAMHQGSEPVMTREIADRQNLPATYLEQLMLTLRKAGLVNATRGARGGYTLSRDPERISLAQIVEALEGKLDIADCADVPNSCTDPATCVLRDVYDEVNRILRDTLDQVSLAQLAEKQRAREAASAGMYFI
jgi:Rrf2 family protein